MALDQSPTRLRVVPFSHTILLHLQAPPWASAVPVALLALAWALLLEALALLVSDSATGYMAIKERVYCKISVYLHWSFFLFFPCSIQLYQ